MGADGWMDWQHESYGNMEKFSSFMHNKFVLFTSDTTSKARELTGDGHDTLMRLSSHKDGYMVAHVSVPMVGYIWEFVGVAPPECDDPSHGECMYTPWSAEECPAAHAFDANLTAISAQISNGVVHKLMPANGTMWVSTHIATSSLDREF
mmetsp:Transcript_49541/g.140321  ORF Transcript_49541/g.140321 Transcript_49541/m.140321 type:complete len:150 (-) Transcript_49541:186-635(-)